MEIITRLLAANPYQANSAKITILDNTMSLSQLIQQVAGWVSILAGVVAFFFLVFSGFTYLTAGGNAENAKKGLQGILNATIGLIIIALAWVLITAVVSVTNNGA